MKCNSNVDILCPHMRRLLRSFLDLQSVGRFCCFWLYLHIECTSKASLKSFTFQALVWVCYERQATAYYGDGDDTRETIVFFLSALDSITPTSVENLKCAETISCNFSFCTCHLHWYCLRLKKCVWCANACAVLTVHGKRCNFIDFVRQLSALLCNYEIVVQEINDYLRCCSQLQ